MDQERARRIGVLAALVLLIGAVVVVAAVTFTSEPVVYQGENTFGVEDGPEVVLVSDDETTLNTEDIFDGDELNIETGEGAIVVGGDPGSSARVNVDDIEGEETVVTDISGGSDWLYLDPADKQRLDVRGDVDAVRFGNATLDDGTADLEIVGSSGGTADVRLYDLPSNEQLVLYNPATGSVLANEQTNTNGTLDTSVELQSSNQELEVRSADSFDAPTISNVAPEGNVTEVPTELTADVTASSFPAEVTFTFEGQTVETTEVSENGTVSADVSVDDLGSYDWSVTVEDDIGQTATRDVSFQTPQELTIREEHDPSQIVDNSTTTLRFYTTDGEIAIERQTDNGTLDMEGLPNSDFVVFIESEDHYDRRVYLGSIFEQEDLYVLNESEFPRGENEAIQSRFVYTDLTGEFPRADTTVQVQRALDLNGDGTSEWRTIAGDFWGAGGEFTATLEHGARYRLFVQNQETGATNMVGTHIPTEDLSHEIRLSGLTQEAEAASGVFADAQLNTSDNTIETVYNDPENETEELTIRITSQDGDETIFEETVSGPLGSYQDVFELNESQAESNWIVHIESERHNSAIPVGSGSVALPVSVPPWIMTLLMSMAVTFVGSLYGPRTAVMGAWAMVFVAAGVAMFGWAFSWPSVVVAMLIATGATFYGKVFP